MSVERTAVRRIGRRTAIAALGLAGAGVAANGIAGCTAPPVPTQVPKPAADVAGSQPPPTPTVPASAPAQPQATPMSQSAATAKPEGTTIRSAPTTPSPASKPAATAESPSPARASGVADLAVVRGQNTADIVRAAVEAVGGIERFVKPGQKVVVKPNICVSSAPEYAATTNPEVVAALVALCREAGAAQVKVLDYGFGGQRTSYQVSGIEDAVRKAGGEMVVISPVKWKTTPIPNGKELKSVAIFDDVLTADSLINVPIAKHHNLARLTLGMKGLLGVIQSREPLHYQMGQKLSDLLTVVRPALTVIDATRILTANGPQGGNLKDVKRLDTVIASPDIVAADAYATGLFGLKPEDLETVRAGAANGIGTMDLSKLKVAQVSRQ